MADTMKLVKLGPVDKVPPGQGLCFVVGEEQIAVFRQRDGKLFATQNLCPHKQGPLSEGLVGSGQVICPFHSHKFDLCTGQGPDQEKLKVYAVKEKDGQLVLTLEPQP
jgi:nitrite reductase (NADH) small subunit